MAGAAVEISLDAVIVAVTDETPRILTISAPGGGPALPSGLLEPQDRTIELGLRRWIREQTALEVGYVEQLYTFGDRERGSKAEARQLSIAYLALVREEMPSAGAKWVDLYRFCPWEDHRAGRPALFEEVIAPGLAAWADGDPERTERVEIVFGHGGATFDGVRALERYELLYEAELLGHAGAASMHLDHGRIVASALSRLRGKLTYRPVVFELLPARFTLLQLQRCVEALAGVELHKQNFRRLVEGAGLVEGTGSLARTGGRPAELHRFRREVLRERPRPGLGSAWVRV